jgi:CheY-like chemotaxis protein
MSESTQKKILLIDDNEMIRSVYLSKLLEAGYQVETAKDGEEGIAKMIAFLPDLVLLDMFMPKLTGFDVVEQIKAEPQLRDIPIIAFSDIRVDQEDLVKKGVKHVFLKGESEPDQVKDVIDKTLN